MPNNKEGALQDAQRSISLIRGRAKEWDIDPAKVGDVDRLQHQAANKAGYMSKSRESPSPAGSPYFEYWHTALLEIHGQAS